MKRKQVNDATAVDPIAALHHAIIQAQEENWSAHGVSEAERAHLRPIVAAQATAVSDQLRIEHANRPQRP